VNYKKFLAIFAALQAVGALCLANRRPHANPIALVIGFLFLFSRNGSLPFPA
jgi:hypothetical protein